MKQISEITFIETFAEENTESDMTAYLNKELSIEKLSLELKNKDSAFYFAVRKSQVIGYLKVNLGSSQTEEVHKNSLEIERVYVLKEFHGMHVGRMLLEKAIELANSQNSEFVWLGVWEKNHKAIRFYEKNGFKPFDKHIFRLGEDEQTDIMMKLDLRGSKV
ncbi:MAG: GNAT family N-acetyltransferase [Bacteroidia bacterium]